MHPIGQLLPRLFPALLVITAAVLITQLLTDDLEPAEAGGNTGGSGDGEDGEDGES